MTSLSRLLRRAFCTTTTLPYSTKQSRTAESLAKIIFAERDLDKIVSDFKKFSESEKFRTKPNVYQKTVQRLADAKLFNRIEEILEEQKQYKDISNEGFVVRLISLYGKAGMFDHAYKLFEEMPQLKCERTVKSFNAVLSACVKSKKFEKIDELFRELPTKLSIKPDSVSYNTVIKAFCDMGSLDLAVALIDEMEKNGVEPTVITFNTLLKELYKSNKVSDAEKVWKRMEKCKVKPDAITYHAKLESLISDKQIQGAKQLLEEMKKMDLKPNYLFYNALIKAYCDNGDLEEAKWCYEEMKMNGYSPDKLTFTVMAPLACEKNDLLVAFQLAKAVIRKKYFGVDEALLQQVVDGLMKKSKTEEANELVKLGKENPRFPYKLKIHQQV